MPRLSLHSQVVEHLEIADFWAQASRENRSDWTAELDKVSAQVFDQQQELQAARKGSQEVQQQYQRRLAELEDALGAAHKEAQQWKQEAAELEARLEETQVTAHLVYISTPPWRCSSKGLFKHHQWCKLAAPRLEAFLWALENDCLQHPPHMASCINSNIGRTCSAVKRDDTCQNSCHAFNDEKSAAEPGDG